MTTKETRSPPDKPHSFSQDKVKESRVWGRGVGVSLMDRPDNAPVD